jgi:hypothetical protein
MLFTRNTVCPKRSCRDDEEHNLWVYMLKINRTLSLLGKFIPLSTIHRQLTLRSWALLARTPSVQLLENLSAFYETQKFITAFAKALQLSLSLARLIQSIKQKQKQWSPRAIYTYRATAASRRSGCQLLRIKGATWSAWRIPTAVF